MSKKEKDNSVRKDKKYVIMNTQRLNNEVVWVYNFTKMLVCVISLLFIIAFCVSVMVISTKFPDGISTFWTDVCDVLKVCVFGYFAKSGTENIFKTRNNRSTQKDTDYEKCEDMTVPEEPFEPTEP